MSRLIRHDSVSSAGDAQPSRNAWLLISLCYVAANVWIPFSSGIFWDDWMVFGQSSRDLIKQFTDYGIPLWGYVHAMLDAAPQSLVLYRIIIFVSYWIGFLLCYEAVRDSKVIPEPTLLIAVCLAACIPLNIAKNCLICLPYAICFAVFFLAWWLAIRSFKRRSPVGRLALRGASLALFTFSFLTPSLLMFFAWPMLHIWFLQSRKLRISTRVLKAWDFALLPFAFWFLKGVWMKPSGFAEEASYNVPTIKGALTSPFNFLFAIDDALQTLITDGNSLNVIALVLLALLFAFAFRRVVSSQPNDQPVMWYAGLAFLLLLSAMFPYLVVEKYPRCYPFFLSRHQLLMPFGMSLVLIAVIEAFSRAFQGGSRLRLLAVSVLVSVFIIESNVRYWTMHVENCYMSGVISQIGQSNVVRTGTAFVFDEQLLPLEPNRMIKTKEYCGYMRLAFGDERRFGISVQEVVNYRQITHSGLREYFNFADFQYVEPDYMVKIIPTEVRIGKIRFVKSVWSGLSMDRKAFCDSMSDLVTLEYEPFRLADVTLSTQ